MNFARILFCLTSISIHRSLRPAGTRGLALALTLCLLSPGGTLLHASAGVTGGSFTEALKALVPSLPSNPSTDAGLLDEDTAAAWTRMLADPGAAIASLAAQSGGEARLALILAVAGPPDPGAIELAMEPFLTAANRAAFVAATKSAAAKAVVTKAAAAKSAAIGVRAFPGKPDAPGARGMALPVAAADRKKDAALHIMGGAAAALLAASVAFQFLATWDPLSKALLLAAIGICAATVFGALKEAMDAFGPGAVELRDFLNTIAGGALQAPAIFAFTCLYSAIGLCPVAAIVIFAVGSLVLGIPVGKVFIESSLGGLKAPRIDA